MSTAQAPSMTDFNSSLMEGRDYYWEGAVIVFTARYLLARGYCCDSGCRHCPFGEREPDTPVNLRHEPQ
jgi:hypothetical protein